MALRALLPYCTLYSLYSVYSVYSVYSQYSQGGVPLEFPYCFSSGIHGNTGTREYTEYREYGNTGNQGNKKSRLLAESEPAFGQKRP